MGGTGPNAPVRNAEAEGATCAPSERAATNLARRFRTHRGRLPRELVGVADGRVRNYDGHRTEMVLESKHGCARRCERSISPRENHAAADRPSAAARTWGQGDRGNEWRASLVGEEFGSIARLDDGHGTCLVMMNAPRHTTRDTRTAPIVIAERCRKVALPCPNRYDVHGGQTTGRAASSAPCPPSPGKLESAGQSMGQKRAMSQHR